MKTSYKNIKRFMQIISDNKYMSFNDIHLINDIELLDYELSIINLGDNSYLVKLNYDNINCIEFIINDNDYRYVKNDIEEEYLHNRMLNDLDNLILTTLANEIARELEEEEYQLQQINNKINNLKNDLLNLKKELKR